LRYFQPFGHGTDKSNQQQPSQPETKSIITYAMQHGQDTHRPVTHCRNRKECTSPHVHDEPKSEKLPASKTRNLQ